MKHKAPPGYGAPSATAHAPQPSEAQLTIPAAEIPQLLSELLYSLERLRDVESMLVHRLAPVMDVTENLKKANDPPARDTPKVASSEIGQALEPAVDMIRTTENRLIYILERLAV